MHVLGLMSGTSADGVDAVLAQFEGHPAKPKWKILNLVSTPYPNDLQKIVIDVGQGKQLSGKEWLDLSETITEIHSIAAQACDPQQRSSIVGCHGQTIYHRAPNQNQRGASLQILQAPLLAQLLNRAVVYDFRSKDLALKGQGAPLAPLADFALLNQIHGWRSILNLGGIANLTLIPPLKGPDSRRDVTGWDCGPANSLIDLAIQKLSNGTRKFDSNGTTAAKGTPDERTIKQWLKEPFFDLTPPKSTGRETFGQTNLTNRLKDISNLSAVNQMATITAFSAAIVAHDLDKLNERNSIRPLDLLVAGGGRKNLVLLRELKNRCHGTSVKVIDEIGLPGDGREALAFALFAWWHSRNHRANCPSITGAAQRIILGIRANPSY